MNYIYSNLQGELLDFRQDKLMCRVNAITTVIATENWIIKTSPYFIHIAHQSDTALIAVKVIAYNQH